MLLGDYFHRGERKMRFSGKITCRSLQPLPKVCRKLLWMAEESASMLKRWGVKTWSGWGSRTKRRGEKENVRCFLLWNSKLTDASDFSVLPCGVPAPLLGLLFFFFFSSRCSFWRFCTSMRVEIKVFFTSFSKSSSSRRASCCTSSSENLLMSVSVSSRCSLSLAMLRLLTSGGCANQFGAQLCDLRG